jgi:hypothetical protein
MAQPFDLASYRRSHNATSVAIGTNSQTNTIITVSQEALQSGTYVLGVQGMGKTSLLEHILLQQLELEKSVILLDPHGDLAWSLLGKIPPHREKDTYFLDLRNVYDWPFGMNIFTLPPDKRNSRKERDSICNQVMHAFEKLWPETKTGLYFGNVLRPVIATLLEQQDLTLAHVARLFSDERFRQHYTANLTDPEASGFWLEYEGWSRSKRERQVDPLLDRLKKLLSQKPVRFILCQKGKSLDLASMIKNKKNILLRLPLRDPAFEQAAPIIGTFFITLLQAAIFSMHQFPKEQVIILPHAEDYRDVYTISLNEVVLTLNEPEVHEGLSDDRYTAEKTIGDRRIYLYYYQTCPMKGKQDELYAIVDFIGFTAS